MSRKELLVLLTTLQYQRNDIEFKAATFRVRGEAVEVYVVTGEKIIRIELNADSIEKILEVSPKIAGEKKKTLKSYTLFPATFWVAPQDKLKIAINNIRAELSDRLQVLRGEGKLLEAERLEQR